MRCGIPADGISACAHLGSIHQGGAERGSPDMCGLFSLGPPSRAPLLDFCTGPISSRRQPLLNQLRLSGV